MSVVEIFNFVIFAMDIWEDLLDSSANFKVIDNFRKALGTARNLLTTDLTVFERGNNNNYVKWSNKYDCLDL